MKILAIRGLGAMAYERLGWANAFKSLGHEIFIYDPEKIATFDVFTGMEPDVYIGNAWELTRAVHKCIKARPNLKSLFIVGDWGPLTDTIDLEKYPILTANEQQKDAIGKLKEETDQPNGVFVHYHQNWIDRTLSGWKTIGVHPFGLPHATDIYDYAVGEIIPRYQCDIGFVGGFWPYKAGPLRKYIWKVCTPEFKTKIYGNNKWSVSQYCGTIAQENIRHLYRTATICPNVFEPHSLEFGFDVTQRVFQTLSSGGFCISEAVQSLTEDFFGEDTVPTFNDEESYMDLIRKFTNDRELTTPYIHNGLHEVYKHHTYHHRVVTMFEKLGLTAEAAVAQSAAEVHYDRIIYNLPKELKC